MTPSTPSGRRLLDWFGGPMKPGEARNLQSSIVAIEAEAEREAVEAYRLDLRTKIEAMIQEAGGLCVAPDDPEDWICVTHSELLFDGFCEDDPRELRAVLRLIEGEKETPPRAR